MLGLVLEGGGAKGAYQIGAWEAFRHMGIEFDAVTGTSVGALNGALIVQGDFEKAYDLWYNLRPEQVIQGDPKAIEKLAGLEVGMDDVESLARYAASVFTSGGLDISPLKFLLTDLVDEERIRCSKTDFGMVTVSLTDFKPKELFIDEIPNGQLLEYLLASSNLPVFKLSRLNGKLYIDGGFYDNLPINLMARKGVREIVAVELKSLGIRQPIKQDNLKITWITPSEDIGRILEFKPDKIRRNMKLGYYDTLRGFRGYRGASYYLDGCMEKGWAMQKLLCLTEEELAPVRSWMGAEEMDSQRFLFEMLLPALGALVEAPASEDYDDLMLRLYEAMAKASHLERLQIIDINTFVESVGHAYMEGESLVPGAIVESVAKRLRQNPVYLRTRKDEFLPWVFRYFMKRFNHK